METESCGEHFNWPTGDDGPRRIISLFFDPGQMQAPLYYKPMKACFDGKDFPSEREGQGSDLAKSEGPGYIGR
jgi:hypothetical protein